MRNIKLPWLDGQLCFLNFCCADNDLIIHLSHEKLLCHYFNTGIDIACFWKMILQ